MKKWLPLLVMGLAIIIIVLDTTLLNVSLATIVRDLKTDIRSLQWVITAYSLTLAALTITGGRFGDLFGRKRMFMVGAVIFAIGSLLASLSHNVGTLILGESIIEGIGAALMMPATSSLLVATYKGKDRALALGVWGGMAAAGSAIGPVVGGYLTSHYSWRWGFRINVFVAALLVLGSFLIKESADKEEKNTIDWLGVVLSSTGLTSLVFSIIESSNYGWWKAKEAFSFMGHALNLGGISIVPVALGLGVALLSLFFVWEQRVVAAGRTPLVSMKLFRNKQFTSGALLTTVMAVGQVGLVFGLPVFLQGVRGLDALHTGYALLPLSIGLFIMAPLGGILAKRYKPKRIVQVGLLVNVFSLLLLRQSIVIDATSADFIMPLLMYGAGMGLVMSQLSNITLSAVAIDEAGEASGVNNTLRQVGSSLGTALIGSIIIASIGTGLKNGISSSPVFAEGQKQRIAAAAEAQSSNIEFGMAVQGQELSASEASEIKRIANTSTVSANRQALLYTAGFSAAALLIASQLPNVRLSKLERNESLAAKSTAH